MPLRYGVGEVDLEGSLGYVEELARLASPGWFAVGSWGWMAMAELQSCSLTEDSWRRSIDAVGAVALDDLRSSDGAAQGSIQERRDGGDARIAGSTRGEESTAWHERCRVSCSHSWKPPH